MGPAQLPQYSHETMKEIGTRKSGKRHLAQGKSQAQDLTRFRDYVRVGLQATETAS